MTIKMVPSPRAAIVTTVALLLPINVLFVSGWTTATTTTNPISYSRIISPSRYSADLIVLSSTSSGGDADDKSNNRHQHGHHGDNAANDDNRSDNKKKNINISNNMTNEQHIDKRLRVMEAQDKIERILSGPDAPFDMEAELSKVISMAPPVKRSLLEQELEQKENELERDLYQAVKEQDYGTAAEIQQEISQLHIDDCAAVLQANALFYRAFSQKDLAAMSGLWLHDSTTTCIHPSCQPLVGARAVLKSWSKMFENTNGGAGKSWMEPHNIRISVQGASTAIITCDEHVFLRRFVRGEKRQNQFINKLTATNIFRKVADKWYLTYHHASWHPDSQAAKYALKHSSSAGSSNSVAGKGPGGSKRNLPGILGPKPRVIRASNDISDEELSSMLDGILGTSDHNPVLGPDAAADSPLNAKGRPVKRIILGMGGLSDFLSGNNLGDILGSDPGGLSGRAGGEISGGNAIIRFSNVNNEDEDDDDDLDEDDDDEEEDEDDMNDYEDEDDIEVIIDEDVEEMEEDVSSVVQQLSDTPASSNGKASTKKATNDSSNNKGNGTNNHPKDALRQSCITALRRLAEQGTISPKQKRVLLTDIITCSAKGQFSMVEVAYELLYGEGDDQDAAEEEFADQCRVFAQQLTRDDE